MVKLVPETSTSSMYFLVYLSTSVLFTKNPKAWQVQGQLTAKFDRNGYSFFAFGFWLVHFGDIWYTPKVSLIKRIVQQDLNFRPLEL